MKSGIYYRGKFIVFDPIQLDVHEKCYIVYESHELESPENPDTFIAIKTGEVHHESGAVIHYHLQKSAPQKLRTLVRSCKEEIKVPWWVIEKEKRVPLKGLQKIIAYLKEKGEL